MHTNEETLAGNADADASYSDADPDPTWFEYRLYWYVDYSIRMMFLCFKFSLSFLHFV